MAVKRILLPLAAIALLLTAGCADMGRAKEAYKAGDYESARKDWSTLAEMGSPEAKINLAMMDLKGQGSKQDTKTTIRLLKEAADSGNQRALVELGNLYEDGIYVRKNNIRARDYYNLAAKLGDERAMARLAGMAEKDGRYTDAYRLYTTAFKNGYAKSAPKISALYEKGLGRKIDRVKALAWLYAGQNLGLTDLQKGVSRLESSLNSVQSEQARELSKGLAPK